MPSNEIYLEIQHIGNQVKVNAIDPLSGLEASVFGPASSIEHLKNTAVKKLEYVIKKKKG